MIGRRRARGRSADALVEAGTLARGQGVALLLMVDEAQNASEAAFGALWHALQEAQGTAEVERGPRGERLRRHLPLAVYVAGLPGVLELGRRAGVTFSERVAHLDFGLLPPADVRDALTAFAANADVAFDDEAADRMVALVGGYPYFLHLLGRRVWRAGSGPVVTLAEVEAGWRDAQPDLAAFYGERLRPLGELQHDWLLAAAALGVDERTSGAVAARLGRPVAALGSTVAGLLGHGLVRRTAGRGGFAFAVPGLDAHLRGR